MLVKAIIKKYARWWPVLIFLSVSLSFWYVSPDTIIGYIGIENAYVIIFVLAFLGGVTTFSGIPYHVILMALALGGLNPWILGLVTALAVTLGDITSYMVGYYGRDLFPARIVHALERLVHVRTTYPGLLPVIFFLYGALIPASSDLITIPMGILRYPIHKVLVPLALGTVLFNTGLALIAVHASGWVSWLL